MHRGYLSAGDHMSSRAPRRYETNHIDITVWSTAVSTPETPGAGAPETAAQPPAESVPQPPINTAPPAPAAPQNRNVLGIIALVAAIVGFIFACIPGALVVGWVLLPIAFILGIVSLFMKDKVKWQGITAIIVSAVGTIVGFIVFFAVVAAAFNTAFDSDVKVNDKPAAVEDGGAAAVDDEPAGAETGTRENPAPLGSEIEGKDWTVVINSVNLDATDAVLKENQFNDKPDAGHVYIGVNYTVTYTGNDADGGTPAWVTMEYVSADGVSFDGLEKIIMGPDEMDTLKTLYNGASLTGNRYLQVPTPVDGVIAVSPGMIADKVFVATK